MNQKRRKSLKNVCEYLEQASSFLDLACDKIEDIRSDESDAMYNMPESLQYSDRFQDMENAVDMMQDATESMYSATESISSAIDSITDTINM